MRICGVDLVSNEAVICLLSYDSGMFDIPDCRVRKIVLAKNHLASDLRHFQFTFAKLLEDYRVDRVVVRERATKGKFAGGALSFKMEAAIQLIDAYDTQLLSSQSIKAAVKEQPLPVDFSATGLKNFQENALMCAFAAHLVGDAK